MHPDRAYCAAAACAAWRVTRASAVRQFNCMPFLCADTAEGGSAMALEYNKCPNSRTVLLRLAPPGVWRENQPYASSANWVRTSGSRSAKALRQCAKRRGVTQDGWCEFMQQ